MANELPIVIEDTYSSEIDSPVDCQSIFGKIAIARKRIQKRRQKALFKF